MINICIHHTLFTEINKNNSPHQSEHNIITTPTEVDKYTQSTSYPFTILQHKFTTVITLFGNVLSMVCLLNSPSYCPYLKFLINYMLLVARRGCAALSPVGLTGLTLLPKPCHVNSIQMDSVLNCCYNQSSFIFYQLNHWRRSMKK